MPVYGVRTAYEFLDRILSAPKSVAAMVTGFGILALLLAAVGLYGVMSYVVAQRTREIGVRIALGAQPRDLIRLILRQGGLLALVGMALGLVGAFALARLTTSLLYGVSPSDPLTFALTPISLILIVLLACWIPARRAGKVDPLAALKYE
jgi:ABC-type antimicrobial peptide transport system permease subunit